MPESRQRTVSVSYRRQVSDGRFGTEAAEVSLQWFIDDDVESTQDQECAEEMLRVARDLVLGQLRTSLSDNVRRAVLPRPAPAMASTGSVAADPADDEDTF